MVKTKKQAVIKEPPGNVKLLPKGFLLRGRDKRTNWSKPLIVECEYGDTIEDERGDCSHILNRRPSKGIISHEATRKGLHRGNTPIESIRKTKTPDEVMSLLAQNLKVLEDIKNPRYPINDIIRAVKERWFEFRKDRPDLPPLPKDIEVQDWQEWWFDKKKNLDDNNNVPPPIKVNPLWRRKGGSLEKLRDIDDNPQEGIKGDAKQLARLREWVGKRGPKRPDIAAKLHRENGQIITSMPRHSMLI